MNHKVYATVAGLDYRFENGPFEGLSSVYYFKLAAVRQALARYDWVVWMDDDAFVTDFERRTFTEIIEDAEAAGKFLVIGDSPLSAAGDWTKINSGVMCLKNCADSAALIDMAMRASLSEVREWWDEKAHGKFTNGDQDALLWSLRVGGYDLGTDIVPHTVFNSRTYEYSTSASDHFVCHFPGVPDKRVAISQFARRLGLDDSLMAPAMRARFGVPAQILSGRRIRYRAAVSRVRQSMP